MKLKTYIIPNFKTIEVRSECYCDEITIISNRSQPGQDEGETHEFDAPIFREGIWDED